MANSNVTYWARKVHAVLGGLNADLQTEILKEVARITYVRGLPDADHTKRS
jgi:hypothetical protein